MSDISNISTAGTPPPDVPAGSLPVRRGKRGLSLGRRAAPLAFVAALAAAVAIRDPHQSGSWAVCPTYAISGLYCPGCGTLRALHDLVTGRIWESMGHNLLLIPAILFLAYSAIGRPGPRWSLAWLISLVLFTVARNLPGSPLAP